MLRGCNNPIGFAGNNLTCWQVTHADTQSLTDLVIQTQENWCLTRWSFQKYPACPPNLELWSSSSIGPIKLDWGSMQYMWSNIKNSFLILNSFPALWSFICFHILTNHGFDSFSAFNWTSHWGVGSQISHVNCPEFNSSSSTSSLDRASAVRFSLPYL